MSLGIRLLHVDRDVLPDEAGHYRSLGYQDVLPRNQQTQHAPEDRDTSGLYAPVCALRGVETGERDHLAAHGLREVDDDIESRWNADGLGSLDLLHMTDDLRSLPDYHSTVDENVICYLEFHPLAIGNATWTKGLAEANIDHTPSPEHEASR